MHKRPDRILVIIQSRLSSKRLKNKMLLPFGGSCLFEIAVKKLANLSSVPKSSLYVSVHDKKFVEIARKYGINIYHRSYESANNDNSLQTIYEWHDKLDFDYVIKINACSPFLKVSTIDKFIKTYINQKEESLFGVIPTKDYYWNSEGKLVTPWPKNQTIMNTKAVDVTFKAAHTLYASRMDLISKNMFMGDFNKPKGIKLYPMDELECFDIDYEWQFRVAKSILESGDLIT